MYNKDILTLNLIFYSVQIHHCRDKKTAQEKLNGYSAEQFVYNVLK